MVLAQVERQSVQTKPDATQESSDVLDFLLPYTRGPILERYGTQRRQEQLLDIYRNDYNWAVKGAFASIGKLIGSTKYDITGPDNGEFNIDYWQQVLMDADFGGGWLTFVQKLVLDYLRYDRGAFIEIIGPGDPRKELTGPVIGVAHLDSLRCMPTGDPDFPVIYIDRKNKMHRMHRSRIAPLLDAPDGDERRPGYGQCALSRAVSIVQREVQMGRYIEAFLDDKPPPGVIMTSLPETKVRAYMHNFRDDQNADLGPEWGRQLILYGLGPDVQTTWESAPFQQPPEKFDFEQYTARVDMPALALAIGLDVQDLWQLTGGNLGSGEQSEILHQKSKGKTIGTLMTSLERVINFNILPEEYEIGFDTRDVQEEHQQATAAGAWMNAINTASAHLMDEEARELIAGVDERFRDAMTDDSGEIRVRTDLDRKPEGHNDDITRREDEAVEQGQPANGRAEERTRQLALDLGGQPDRSVDTSATAKDFQATRLTFEVEWADLITAAKSGDMERGRFRIVARALLRRHGLQAYKDGLEQGGVVVDALDDTDSATFAAWLAGRSSYIGGLADQIYKQEIDVNPQSTADMWANTSLQEPYYDGLTSASANGMYEFAGSDGAESCATCVRLKGQRHRMKDWTRRQLRPGVDVFNFICGGFHCNHVLIPTTERARGRF